MASEIEICNIALSNIRAASINTFTENSVQAQQCQLKYPILRDRCLKELAWQFNRKIVALALLEEVEVLNYAFAYAYPTDCLKIQRILTAADEVSTTSTTSTCRHRGDRRGFRALRGPTQQVPYEVFNFSDVKVIGANCSDIRIDYSSRVRDPNLFSEDFIMAFSYLLSAELAIPIVGAELGRALRRDSLELYQQYLASAIADDINDKYTERRDSEYVSIRR